MVATTGAACKLHALQLSSGDYYTHADEGSRHSFGRLRLVSNREIMYAQGLGHSISVQIIGPSTRN